MDATLSAHASVAAPDLLSVLRERKAQAQLAQGAYGPRMARDTMSYWLAEAAKAVREAADRKIIHIAAGADTDQSTVWRFENHRSTPRDLDLLIASYADDLGIDPIDIWDHALKLWRESGDQANVAELTARRDSINGPLEGPGEGPLLSDAEGERTK